MKLHNRLLLHLLAFWALFLAVWPAGARASTGARSGRDLYNASCASCHGARGAGNDPGLVNAPLPLPDFSDCSFASREPDADWGAIIQEGGPARGFNRWMPAFGDALTDGEIALVLGHVRTFCDDDRWPRGDLNLPKALRTEKAFPEDELLLVTRVGTGEASYANNKLIYEKRIGPSSQIEVVAPFSALESTSDGAWTAGIGDLALAFKQVVVSSLRTGTISSLTLEAVAPTGDVDRGLGDGHFVLEPFWTVGQVLPAESFFQTQIGAGIPLTFTDYEAFGRLAAGKTFTQGVAGRSWTPMVEVLAATSIQDIAMEWTFVPQLQFSLPQRQHILVDVGVGLPLEEGAIGEPEIIVYLLWDWYDGGLLEGW